VGDGLGVARRAMKAVVLGIAGARLAPEEAELLRHAAPAGVILFSRNIVDPLQLRALIDALRAVLPPTAVLMVDQEGGRVARLRPPHWRVHPPAARIGALHAARPEAGLRAAWLTGALIGLDCIEAGFEVVCAPVLDLAYPQSHQAIGDRTFGPDPAAVAGLGRAMADGLRAAGVQPVMKHLPGHGRAVVDSHFELPVVADVDLAADIAPFAANADLPWAITAHILYEGLDSSRPATLSPRVIGDIIRGGIGFQGVLVSDDLAMRALNGPPAQLVAQALTAGCDLALFCPGDFAANEAVLAACPEVTTHTRARLETAGAAVRRVALDGATLAAERAGLLAA
jgi:beta-N-acetylhexosaminidase